MMNYTDRHFRMFMRLLTKKTWLYTPMISTKALLHGDTKYHLSFSQEEKPIVLQLGGSDVSDLTRCSVLAEEYGYDEINLNAGCPSERVQNGKFGATLMIDIKHTASLIKEMTKHTSLPITIKCRTGIDGRKCNMPHKETYKELYDFVEHMVCAGAQRIIIHARTAILGGLSPKGNRNIPPLQYEFVKNISHDFKGSFIEVNGGITTFQDILLHKCYANAVMIGRVAINSPCMFVHADSFIDTILHNKTFKTNCDTPDNNTLSMTKRASLAIAYAFYIQKALMQEKENKNLSHKNSLHRKTSILYSLRHIINIYTHKRGAQKWRASITKGIIQKQDPLVTVHTALKDMHLS